MRKKKTLSILLVALLSLTLLSGCGNKQEEETETPVETETSEDVEAETFEETESEEENTVQVTARELWDNAWNDVESVTSTEYEDVQLTVKRGIVPTYIFYILEESEYSEDQEEFNYIDRSEFITQMMSDGSAHCKYNYTIDNFDFSEEKYDAAFSEYYNMVEGRVFTDYSYNSEDEIWERYISDYTDDEDFSTDNLGMFISDEPRDLEITDETDTEWIVSGVITKELIFEAFAHDLLLKPESDEEDDDDDSGEWEKTDVHVIYTFDKETGHLLKAEYNYEDIYNYYKTDFFEEGVVSVDNMVWTVTYTDYNSSAFTVGPEITEGCRDLNEYYDSLDEDYSYDESEEEHEYTEYDNEEYQPVE